MQQRRRDWKEAVRILGALAGLTLGGCAPLTPTTPFHFGESAQVLPKGGGSATLTLGGGSLNYGRANGLGLRGRFGLGGRQEAGAEVLLLGIENDDKPNSRQPWRGRSDAYLGKLSYKIGLAEWLAASLGAGGSSSATGDALGGDVALHASPEPWGIVRPYLGLRYSLAAPLNRGYEEAGGATQGTVLALGGLFEFSRQLHAFGELGRVRAWHTGYASTREDPSRQALYFEHEGNYMALGVTAYFGNLWGAP